MTIIKPRGKINSYMWSIPGVEGSKSCWVWTPRDWLEVKFIDWSIKSGASRTVKSRPENERERVSGSNVAEKNWCACHIKGMCEVHAVRNAQKSWWDGTRVGAGEVLSCCVTNTLRK